MSDSVVGAQRQAPVIILGIDPGLANTGWGIIEQRGTRRRALAYGCISTDAATDIAQRLRQIHDELVAVIERYQPSEVGVEVVYFGSNAKSALATGQARGAALVAVASQGLVVGEYSPTRVKQVIVGEGHAEKQQVQYMVKALLKLDHTPTPDHAADALAVALCHAQLRRLP
ncbi:MAG: crossover junction endodeoxyribonuclease RuvC [Coriobacteriales bacterium]|jgi:crossover junction endodeoxyribonuclease RuvC|nr:crossover junction endodeoxyribonuclease RuvC [Coriobacteriales bacterium]